MSSYPAAMHTVAPASFVRVRVRRELSERTGRTRPDTAWGHVTEDERPFLRALGSRLRALRQSANVSQAGLARRAGLARSTVERLEGGQRRARESTLVVLLEALHALRPDLGARPELLAELVALAGPALAVEREPRWAARRDKARQRRARQAYRPGRLVLRTRHRMRRSSDGLDGAGA